MANSAEMVEMIRRHGVHDERVLQAIKDVDRADFLPLGWRLDAYADAALAIGFGQTISQPYTVARMIELLVENSKSQKLQKSRVLEVGTGSGWQTAVLAQLFGQVYSVELVPQLARQARIKIYELGFMNIKIKVGDGKLGWQEHAPYQAVIVAADAKSVPRPLIKQLAEGGRVVIPVKEDMRRGCKHHDRMSWESFGKFLFVPLV